MADIPHGVLTEAFEERIAGRRIVAGVFLTFCFEPDFFEQEILPEIVDLPQSGSTTIRLIHLDDELHKGIGPIAVYFDKRGLVAAKESPKLGVRRVEIRYRNGYFHPKNVLLLVEPTEPNEAGIKARSLIVACLSANLTRAGWWANVEVCHIEEVADGATSGFRDDLLDLVRRLKDAAPKDERHEALEMVRAFALSLNQRAYASTAGVFHSRMYSGGASVPDFLASALGNRLDGLCLEIISPYFDGSAAKPLRDLCERFSPREVRVLLPRDEAATATCAESYYDLVKGLPNVYWAQLPGPMTARGKQDAVQRRTVHAKVYRFFHPHQRYEALLVGSINLTGAAHSKKGNFETGFLVESPLDRVPDWWLEPDRLRPKKFVEPEAASTKFRTSPLSLRFDWHSGTAEAHWDADKRSGTLVVKGQNAPLFTIADIPSRRWQPLANVQAEVLRGQLNHSSFVSVSDDIGDDVVILVQEEGMSYKPSLLTTLSAADILKYWSLLTKAQQAAFIEHHASVLPEVLAELGRDAPPLVLPTPSMFETFAGVFHGFASLQRFIDVSLSAKRIKDAEHRLFGKKHDCLPLLIDRVLAHGANGDVATDYVTLLCARQLLSHMESTHSTFVESYRADFSALSDRVDQSMSIRARLTFSAGTDSSGFLKWFERWFLERAEPMKPTV